MSRTELLAELKRTEKLCADAFRAHCARGDDADYRTDMAEAHAEREVAMANWRRYLGV